MKNSTRLPASGAGRHPGPAPQAGMAIVEFVIISPLALLVVLGIIQLGLMFVAKQILNQATFVAARAGAVDHARNGATSAMRQALINALIPFYQNTLDTNPYARLSNAWANAQADLLPLPAPLGNVDITVLNPSSDVFSDFGLTDSNNHTYIPNDSLEYRDYSDPNKHGQRSGLSIQDANALKIRVTYGYQLKVPLMQSVFKSVMCGFDSGVNAFGRGGGMFSGIGSLQDCIQYYNRGRVPIVAYATVQMQSPAWQ